eukprot:gene15526-18443_t
MSSHSGSPKVSTSPAQTQSPVRSQSPVRPQSPAARQPSPVAAANQSENVENAQVANQNNNPLRKLTPLTCLVFMISILVLALGITQIAVASAKDGLRVRHTWAIFINGLFCMLLGFASLVVVFLPRPKFYKFYALFNLYVFVQFLVFFIIFSSLVRGYIRDDCNGHIFWNSYCSELELYLGVSLARFIDYIIGFSSSSY